MYIREENTHASHVGCPTTGGMIIWQPFRRMLVYMYNIMAPRVIHIRILKLSEVGDIAIPAVNQTEL